MHLNFTFLLMIAAACVPPGFRPGEPAQAEESAPSTSPIISDARLRGDLLSEVNRGRRAAGVADLVEDAALAAAASDYALELARKRQLSHESETPGRRTMAERLQAAGATDWIAAGENLAAVHSSDPMLVHTIVQGWLDSPGHRRNLLDAEYRRAGTGVARAADGYWYIVQVYVRPVPRANR